MDDGLQRCPCSMATRPHPLPYTVTQYAYKTQKVKQGAGFVCLRHFPHFDVAFSSKKRVLNFVFFCI